jgi:hypothetical protein
MKPDEEELVELLVDELDDELSAPEAAPLVVSSLLDWACAEAS